VDHFEEHIPAVAKAAIDCCGSYGTAEEAAEKVILQREPRPQRLKPYSEQCSYRSGEPLHPITPKAGVLRTPALRHPKAKATSSFSASCEAVPFQNKFKLSTTGLDVIRLSARRP